MFTIQLVIKFVIKYLCSSKVRIAHPTEIATAKVVKAFMVIEPFEFAQVFMSKAPWRLL
jgi:hypothetical protein